MSNTGQTIELDKFSSLFLPLFSNLPLSPVQCTPKIKVEERGLRECKTNLYIKSCRCQALTLIDRGSREEKIHFFSQGKLLNISKIINLTFMMIIYKRKFFKNIYFLLFVYFTF